MPGKIAGKILLQQRKLDLLLDIPIIGQRRMTFEHQLPRRPDVDEIRRDALPVRIVNPAMRKIRRGKERGVDHEQREADLEQRGRNVVLRRQGHRGG